MNQNKGLLCLAVLRIVFGWMMIWAFLDKLFGLGMLTTPENAIINGGSPTEYYLGQLVSGPLTGVWNALAGNAIVDFLLMAGLLLVGIGLIFGIASKLSTIGMSVMMIFMFALHVPPADNPLVDYHLAYVLAMLAIYWLGGFDHLSLNAKYLDLGIVKRVPILQ